jgi:hypothetical protein
LTGLAALAIAAVAIAHGGGLDQSGGHHDRKNGGYHFHRGPLAGRSFADKAAALAALRAREQPAQPEQRDDRAAIERATAEQKLEALKRALIRAGVIEHADYERALREVVMQR